MNSTALPTEIREEAARRRTFAIISHPDAGKTTLTEKLLLYGGAIQLAGSVHARKGARKSTSDWMELEKQRGISVTSTVLQFEYGGHVLNLLDTPGHNDFSADTYRTLTAADSAVMLIDNAKGVEAQTKKLFAVCRQRGIPIFTFVNKMDHAGRGPLTLLTEVEDVLGIRSVPVNWPVGQGDEFRGIFDRESRLVHLYGRTAHGATKAETQALPLNDASLPSILGKDLYDQLVEDIELIDVAGEELDLERVAKGELTPVFFGSAITNFGVEPFLQRFLGMAPPPAPRCSEGEWVEPDAPFSGFVFKIQANMDPAHRDRIAFMRVVSGRFEKDMEVVHGRTGKKLRLTRPQRLFAQERETVEEAYAGDVVGLTNPGAFKLGDTLSFEKGRRVRGGAALHAGDLRDPREPRRDPLQALRQGRGAAHRGGARGPFLGPPVGPPRAHPGRGRAAPVRGRPVPPRHRVQREGRPGEPLAYEAILWIQGTPEDVEEAYLGSGNRLLEDAFGNPVVLIPDARSAEYLARRHPKLAFLDRRPG